MAGYASTSQCRHGRLGGCLLCLRASGTGKVVDNVKPLLLGEARGHTSHEKMITLSTTIGVERICKILPLLAAEHGHHLRVRGALLLGGLYMAIHAQLRCLWNGPSLALSARTQCRGEQEKDDE